MRIVTLALCVFVTVFLLFRYFHTKHRRLHMPHKKMVVVIPSYNNAPWCIKNIDSILSQDYDNYQVIFIDDCSTDGTFELVKDRVKQLGAQDNVTLIKNEQRCGALANRYRAIHMCDDHDIVLTVDGDDWLAHDQVMNILNDVYQDPDVWLTYGQYRLWPTARRGVCRQIPDDVVQKNGFREFAWVSSHLRTFYAGLFKRIAQHDLCRDGSFVPVATDLAMMLPMLEMAGERFAFIPHDVYVYNVGSPINIFKSKEALQLSTEAYIRQLPKYTRLVSLSGKTN